MHRSIPRPSATIIASLALSTFAATGGIVAAGSPTAVQPTIDRAALEALLAERPVTPTDVTRRFELTVQRTSWELLPGVTSDAITFNGTVPGPTIRVTEGDTVEVVVDNQSDEATSIHWHGLHIPNEQDGVAGVTQMAIQPGETYTYRFVAPARGYVHVPRARRSEPGADRQGSLCATHHRPTGPGSDRRRRGVRAGVAGLDGRDGLGWTPLTR